MRKWVKWAAAALFVDAGLLVALSACESSPGSLPLGTAGMPNGEAQAGNAGVLVLGVSGQGNAQRDIRPTFDAATPTKYSACVAYTKAQCQRRIADCGERDRREDPCAWSLDRCPDAFFSPGSAWTVESLLSCAETWKTFSCDEIRQNKRPACAMPKGTRQLGEACLFPNQCASQTCTEKNKDGSGIADYPGCGVCGETSELGGACDVYGYECGLEYVCTSGKCGKRSTVGVVGASCNDDSTCGGYGISCRADPADGVKRCLLAPVAGERCDSVACADGYVCNTNKVCTAGAAQGASCADSAPCALGLVCTGRFENPPSTCIGGRKLGEVCSNSVRQFPRGNCEPGLRCDCGQLDCDLASGVCRQPRGEGDSCAEQNSLCARGTRCADSKCKALVSEPALVELCPL